MDPIKNPFSPGAGSPPPELAGRDPVLNQARILLGRVKARRPEKSLLLTGLRGVGKTVLLNEIERLAKTEGYRTISIEAHEDKPLGKLIAPYLRTLLFDLDRIAGAGNKVKRGLAVLRSFIGSLKFTVNDVAIGLDIEPEAGAADSGDLEIDLPNLFVAIGEAAEDRKSAVAIFIDEVQYFSQKELGSLIMAMHRIQQLQLPLVLLGAGLPILPGLAGESKSYAERLFSFPDIGALSAEDAAKALRDPGEGGFRQLRAFRARGDLSPDEGLPLLRTGVGLSSLEAGRDQSDHGASCPGCDADRHPTPRSELLPGALRSSDPEREELPARDGRTRPGRPAPPATSPISWESR